MDIRYTIVLVVASVGFSLAARGEDRIGTIRFNVSGVTNAITIDGHAFYTTENRLQILAIGDPRTMAVSLSLTIPSPRLGTCSMKGATNMTAFYSRSIYSSSIDAHYDARTEIAGTKLEVSIEKLGEIGEPVQGRFSAIVANHFGQHLTITNGTFRLVRSPPLTDKGKALGTQPLGAANGG